MAAVSILGLLPGCNRPASTPRPEEVELADESIAANERASNDRKFPTRVNIEFNTDDPHRWLVVEKVKGDAPGAWATGAFDAKRNRLTIRTRDVEQFAIDTSRVPIRWKRLVILRIDGNNSELARREHNVLHFVNDKRGWHIDDK